MMSQGGCTSVQSIMGSLNLAEESSNLSLQVSRMIQSYPRQNHIGMLESDTHQGNLHDHTILSRLSGRED